MSDPHALLSSPDDGVARSAFSVASHRLTTVEAEELVRRRYGIVGQASPLHGERDQNLLITGDDGRLWVFKLCHPAEDPDVLDFQARVLLHIAEADLSLPVPRLRHSLAGEVSILVEREGQAARLGRLVSFLPGTIMAGTAASLGQARALGRVAARLGIALSGYTHSAAGHALLWDLRRAGEAREFASCILSAQDRAMVAGVLDRFVAEVAPLLARQRIQVIHSDVNPHNVVVDGTNPDRIAGIIDFGDIVASNLVNDVAIAAAYLPGDADEPLARMGAFISAYHATSPLTDEEIDLLPDLIATRNAMVLAIAAWRTSLHPQDAAYINRNAPAAQRGLAHFAGQGRNMAREQFRAACEGGRAT